MQTNVILAGKCDSQLAIIIKSTTIFCENVVVVKTSYQMFRNFINLAIWRGLYFKYLPRNGNRPTFVVKKTMLKLFRVSIFIILSS